MILNTVFVINFLIANLKKYYCNSDSTETKG